MIVHLVEVGLSLVGLYTWRVLWRLDMEHRFVPIRAPQVLDVNITRDSDYRGLYL